MATKLVQDTSLTAVADAIRTKGETTDALEFPDGFVTAIQNIPAGGGGSKGSETDPVVFIDYDGSVVASYSAEDFLALDAMPPNPSHEGLVSQGWNWSLADAKSCMTVDNAKLTIGQMYTTDDGCTRLYCHFTKGRLHPFIGLLGSGGTATIDWGDGSASSTTASLDDLTANYVNHEYQSEGDYVISIKPNGTYIAIGSKTLLQKSATSSSGADRVYQSALKKVEIGDKAKIYQSAFDNYPCLQEITIPNTVTTIGNYAFRYCHSLVSITIPDSVTSLGNSVFVESFSLRIVSLSNSITTVGNYLFQKCYALAFITIPGSLTTLGTFFVATCDALTSVTMNSGITSIAGSDFAYDSALAYVIIPDSVTDIAGAFSSCSGVGEYHVYPTTPPTLAARAFSGIPSDCKIYVPAESLSAYKSATNWSDYASYMVGE